MAEDLRAEVVAALKSEQKNADLITYLKEEIAKREKKEEEEKREKKLEEEIEKREKKLKEVQEKLEKEKVALEAKLIEASAEGNVPLMEFYQAQICEVRKGLFLSFGIWPVGRDDAAAASTIDVDPPAKLEIPKRLVKRLLQGLDEEEDCKSYAASNVGLGDAEEAAKRVGWRIRPVLQQISSTTRTVAPFNWPRNESSLSREDSVEMKNLVIDYLTTELKLDDKVKIVDVERQMFVTVEKGYLQKRTRLRCKTDYVAILAEAVEQCKISPECAIHAVLTVFETKSSKAFLNDIGGCRGSAAIECLAVHLKLQDLSMLPKGISVPVVMTDMARFEVFRGLSGCEEIEHLVYSSAGAALDHISCLLRDNLPWATNNYLRPASAPHHLSSELDGLCGADLRLGAQNIAQQLGTSGAAVPKGSTLYVEKLEHAVYRALMRVGKVCGDEPGEGFPGKNYDELPPEVLAMYGR